MRLNTTILYSFFAGLICLSVLGCYKEVDCTDSSANQPPPVPDANFRVVNANGKDLLAESTPNSLSFDSLVARQPCNAANMLGKEIRQTGAGGLESYVFSFSNLNQPVTGENEECFTLLLQWAADDVDTVRFITRSEHHSCGVTYYLDGVTFNGDETLIDDNGNYLLRK